MLLGGSSLRLAHDGDKPNRFLLNGPSWASVGVKKILDDGAALPGMVQYRSYNTG